MEKKEKEQRKIPSPMVEWYAVPTAEQKRALSGGGVAQPPFYDLLVQVLTLYKLLKFSFYCTDNKFLGSFSTWLKEEVYG